MAQLEYWIVVKVMDILIIFFHFIRWSILEVHTNSSFPDKVQATAAGMIEGSLTGDLMHKAYQNTLAGYCESDIDFCMKLGKFLGENLKWISAQIANNPEDRYWYQVTCSPFT